MSEKDKPSNELDKERADSEGMNTAIGADSAQDEVQDLLAKPEFLQDVLDHFRQDEELLTVEEAAQALFEELEGLDEYQQSLEKHGPQRLRNNMRDFLGAEEWGELKEEESEREVHTDKTRGGTPG